MCHGPVPHCFFVKSERCIVGAMSPHVWFIVPVLTCNIRVSLANKLLQTAFCVPDLLMLPETFSCFGNVVVC